MTDIKHAKRRQRWEATKDKGPLYCALRYGVGVFGTGYFVTMTLSDMLGWTPDEGLLNRALMCLVMGFIWGYSMWYIVNYLDSHFHKTDNEATDKDKQD